MPFTRKFGGQNIYPSQLTYQLLTLTANVELQWATEIAAPGVLVVSDIIDATGNAVDRVITFPDATLAGPGQSVLINNIGANQILVHDNDGVEIGAVPSGEVWQFYLSDNTTVAGIWETFQFGTGTSAAVAAALAGAGLKAIANTLNVQLTPRSSAVSPLVLLNSDRAKIVQWTGGVGAGTLPDPAVVGSDWFVLVRNNGSGTWTITPTAGDINGAASLALSPFSSAIIYTDGVDYFTIGLSQVTPNNFDFTAINVAGTGTYVLSGTELNRISYRLTGVLTGNRIIEVPATVQQYWINNGTSGAFSLTVKTNAGVGVVVPQGTAMIVYCDGTDVIASDGTPTAGVLPILRGGTNLTSYATGDIIFASATNILGKLAYVATASRYLGQNAGVPGWVQVNLANGVTGQLPFSNLPDGSALSVLGRSANSAGVMASIAGSANQVLRVNSAGTVLGFGQVNLAAAAAVTGTLPVGNGGTGLATFAQGDLIYASAVNVLSALAKSATRAAFLSNFGATNNPQWRRIQYDCDTIAISFTLTLDDAGRIQFNAAGSKTIEIDTFANVAFDIGTIIPVVNGAAAGTLTLDNLGGVTLYVNGLSVASFDIPPGYGGVLWKVDTNTWFFLTNVPPSAGVGVLFAGYIAASAASQQMNPAATAWVATHPATGRLTVTHNLALSSANDLAVTATVINAAGFDDRSTLISGLTVNSFDILAEDVGSGAVDIPVFFHATRLV